MRKIIVSLLLISLLITSMASPVFGTSYRETAWNYLIEKYDVSEERIQLYDGGIIELEYTAESFWNASYIILPDGESALDFSTGEKNVEGPRTLPANGSEPYAMPLPAPDMPASDRDEIHPIAPMDEGHIYGGIYIHTKTGEILQADQMDVYFSAEWKLADIEWQRLRKEAGKLDGQLYLRLMKFTPTEKVSVWIQPAALENDELKAQFQALKEKYPEHTIGMEFTDIFFYGFGYAVPDTGSGVSGGNASVSYGATRAVDLPANLEKSDVEILPVFPDEEYWQEYNEMWKELEQIHLQAITPSIISIKEALDNKGIIYQDNGSSVAADLTVEEINELAELSSVSMIFEDGIFTTMDSSDTMMLRSSTPYSEVTTAKAMENRGINSYLPHILIIVLAFAAVILIYRRRSIANN
ncbi:hypothetical protein [Alkaliphilus peptidifermentans]|uniref:DUF2330 domain-containing protein n=1 Tax=Alkaliphilus peptidifermentans DSM 18978 TaxID=1120976 RepID=A0A1G5K943_9FIRM|nr:hypothetical protein [Alkaliphilus peptidifermentans]SCY97152.1 hypothetical protein SAMN03080606_03330 [Alkaliphilus peptidifermentans DSM 18978]